MTEKDVTQAAPEMTESQKIWQEYLQKCCEVGQLLVNMELIDSQKAQMEKQVEVTTRSAKALVNKFREAQGGPAQAPQVQQPVQ